MTARKFPTALNVAQELKLHVIDVFGLNRRYPDAAIGTMKRDEFHGLEARRFDVKLDDGRVYRIRVSDITPEGVV